MAKNALSPEQLRYVLGLKVRRHRTAMDLGLKELAERCGLSISYLSEIEQGKKHPKPDKLLRLAEALGLSYDELVSVEDRALDPLRELFQSPFIREFPFELFSISAGDVVNLISEVPDKAGAMLRTFLEIGRTYDVRVEHFLFAALRSYQQMHRNYFPELEEAAREFRRDRGWAERETLSYGELRGVLEEEMGCRVDERTLAGYPALEGFRSVWVDGDPPVLLVNPRLLSPQKAFVVGREIGFREMDLGERATTSSWLQVDSFEKVLNNFRASYFAGALLIRQEDLQRQLEELFSQPRWSDAAFVDLLRRYTATPEIFFYRLTEVLPALFGMEDLFFVRVTHERGSEAYTISKLLNLSSIPVPHGSGLNEHHCRRWPGLRVFRRIAEGEAELGVATQRSHFLEQDQSFLVLTLARPLVLDRERLSSVSVGCRIDDDLRRRVAFWSDPEIPEAEVNLTCERCRLSDCGVRAALPTIHHERERQRIREEALERLTAELGGRRQVSQD